ncbi:MULTISPECIES: hypothetical protein [Clostridium]|uniref:hypothetical protein n=1 Tax=Clostridium TaxID=1485 RepID=UPI001E6566C5|nr:hypothetical protein [[Clostridium] innocuum]MCQ5278096.1 hypothetical protein [Clostridium sp. DFI.1.208]DAM37032.1 MAG TPA: hypothetical protein [Caudoviricetes sp.]MCC2844695.1 hypothetical protein [[Clostridium] innocuum]MCC2848947.1 hypothetical protein [[Clostridium] innocuum]MCC2853019.1 hypothetical protein [[Clostridium] innocuum]
MTANEPIIAESRMAKRELIKKAVEGLALDETEKKFLAFLVDMEDMNTVSKFCSIIRKAKEYWK